MLTFACAYDGFGLCRSTYLYFFRMSRHLFHTSFSHPRHNILMSCLIAVTYHRVTFFKKTTSPCAVLLALAIRPTVHKCRFRSPVETISLLSEPSMAVIQVANQCRPVYRPGQEHLQTTFQRHGRLAFATFVKLCRACAWSGPVDGCWRCVVSVMWSIYAELFVAVIRFLVLATCITLLVSKGKWTVIGGRDLAIRRAEVDPSSCERGSIWYTTVSVPWACRW